MVRWVVLAYCCNLRGIDGLAFLLPEVAAFRQVLVFALSSLFWSGASSPRSGKLAARTKTRHQSFVRAQDMARRERKGTLHRIRSEKKGSLSGQLGAKC
jgi:hypothetical protein